MLDSNFTSLLTIFHIMPRIMSGRRVKIMNKTLSLSHVALKQGRQVGILNSIIQCENLSDGWKPGKLERLIEEENAFSSSIGD